MKHFSWTNKLAPYTRQYFCDNDCKQSGCSGHTATFELYHVTDTYGIDFGDGQHIILDGTQMALLLDFVERLTSKD